MFTEIVPQALASTRSTAAHLVTVERRLDGMREAGGAAVYRIKATLRMFSVTVT